ncbi:MAG TPA: HD domain-containing phosphohydrolase [Candidatus Baltobacteraceae bacterium]|nr:HD domain-containing phosphohydrolase [Candidatus Baltobacteraceae bacterium]
MYVAVIDDQEASLAGFSQILKRVADIEPVCFKKASDALHWLTGVDPAFIVVNSTLSDISGIDFIRRLRIVNGRETTPVIFTTGKADRDIRRTAFELDVYAYLEKPINPSEFLVHAMHIVDAARARADMSARLQESAARAGMTAAPVATVSSDGVIDSMLEVAALHDPTIIAHHNLAAKLAIVLGRESKLTAEEQQLIGQAARIYDIGKTAIPQRILELRTPATQADRVTIERHADAGTRLLAGRESAIMRAATVIAQTHHERYDGSGYPRKLRGSSIPIMGRVVAVADALSALIRARGDRPAMTLAQAIELIDRGSGSAYDPTVVNAIRSGLNDISKIVHESQQSAQAS